MNHKNFYLSLIITILVDQLTKSLAVKYLSNYSTFPLINNIFHLTLVKNKVAAFGLFYNQTIFLISVAVLVFIIIYFFKNKFINGRLSEIGLGFLSAGTLGNLTDRILHGYVIDFFDFRVWSVFNISDIAIDIGVALIIFEMFITRNKNVPNNP